MLVPAAPENHARRPRPGSGPLLSALLAVLLLACAPNTPSTDAESAGDPAADQTVETTAATTGTVAGAADSMTLSGTIRYLDVEGGVYVIASDGTNYNPVEGLAEEFRIDGLEVEAEVRRRDDVAGIGMVGPMVEVLSIRQTAEAGDEAAGETAGAAGPADAADEGDLDQEETAAGPAAADAVNEADSEGAGQAAAVAGGEGGEAGESVDDAEAVAADERPAPGGESELWDSAWRLVDLGGRPAMGQVQATLEFPAGGGRAVGNASCNRFFGGVAVDGDSITFLDVGTMRMSCPPAINDQEQRFLAALEGAQRYEVEDRELRIFGADAESPIRFSRIEDQQG